MKNFTLFLFLCCLCFNIYAQTDVTSLLEYNGNPTYTSGIYVDKNSKYDTAYPRNVWDLKLFNNKVYIASGNADNGGFAGNSGPIRAWFYDIAKKKISYDSTVYSSSSGYLTGKNILPDEETQIFKVYDNQMYIPAIDDRGNGNVAYRWNGNAWQRFQGTTVSNTMHNYDIIKFENKFFLGLGRNSGSTIVYSNDGGIKWRDCKLKGVPPPSNHVNAGRIYSFFSLGNTFYATGFISPPSYNNNVYEYQLGTDSFFIRRTDLLAGSLFPDCDRNSHSPCKGRELRRPENFDGKVFYLGAESYIDHHSFPFGLFCASNLNPGNLSVSRVRLERTGRDTGNYAHRDMIWDIIVYDTILYALVHNRNTTNYINKVMALSKGKNPTIIANWKEVLRFTSATFTRSMEFDGTYFYFGLGTGLPLTSQAIIDGGPAELKNESGQIYRVKDPRLGTLPPNKAPKATAPASVSCLEDAATQIISLTSIDDGDATAIQTISITAKSSNTAIVPNPTVTYTTPNTTGSLSFKPLANANGTATIKVVIKDNGGTSGGGVDSLVLNIPVTVTAVNDAPVINAIANQNLTASTSKTINLGGIGDGDADASQSITLTAVSSNTAHASVLVTYTSPNATGILKITTTAAANGVYSITLTLKDNGGVANSGVDTKTITFTVNVSAVVNNNPVMNVLNDLTINEDAASQTINLSGIDDGDGSVTQSLTLTAVSSNTALVPNPTVTYSSPNTTASLSFKPVANANGTATITVTLTDNGTPAASYVDAFVVTVNSVNDKPVMIAPVNMNINKNANTKTVTLLGIDDNDDGSQIITIKAASSNTTLIPTPAISYSGADKAYLTYKPAANKTGTATITVTLTDNGGTTNGGLNKSVYSFTVTVKDVNTAPTIDAVMPQNILEDAPVQIIPLSGISNGGDSAQTVTLKAVERNASPLLEHINISGLTGSEATINYLPRPNANGTTFIRILVKDDGDTLNGGIDSIELLIPVIIASVNDAPSADLPTTINAAAGIPINFNIFSITGNDPEKTESLSILVSTQAPDIITNIKYSPSGSGSGIITFTPTQGSKGSYTMMVTVKDNSGNEGGGSDSRVYKVVVVVGSTTIDHDQDDISLYPIPTDNILIIESTEEISRILVMNLSGIILIDKTMYRGCNTSLNMTSLANGVYIVNLKFVSGKQLFKTITKFN